MTLTEAIEKLNEKTENAYEFMIGNQAHHGDILTLEIRYKDGTILGQDKRNECLIFLLENLPAGVVYDIKFVKNFKTSEVIKKSTEDIIKSKFPSLIYEVESVSENLDEITLKIDEDVFDYAQSRGVKQTLSKELTELYLSPVNVNLVKTAIEVNEENEVPVFIEEKVDHTIPVSEVSAFCGDVIDSKPTYIKDLTSPRPQVTICGKIKYINSRELKKKQKEGEQEQKPPENEEGEQEKEAYVKKLFKFSVEDFSGSINCIYFSTKTTIANAEKLASGSEVVVFGDLVIDEYSGGLTLKAKAINLCVLPKDFKEEIKFKDEPENYTWCFPEPYVSKEQVDLFSVLSGSDSEVSPFLAKNDVVVFDFETTGLSATDCKIIEIGAVKVHEGKIVEQFETFVNPEGHIDDDSTLVHGITDEMVKDAPNYKMALQDFYKFTRNAFLCAYNIAFDFSFLDLYGRKAGFNFNNPQIDALKVASHFVKGVKNYKLKTVADKLGVVLDNAHRAVYDTIATAEVLIKLAGNVNVDGTF
ncbi:MAG: ribonuclease H-like domain-containing protein [Clostridia bacterium]|nr:ribonuclease H-like domain-containing protein [Clostridia bacterium]